MLRRKKDVKRRQLTWFVGLVIIFLPIFFFLICDTYFNLGKAPEVPQSSLLSETVAPLTLATSTMEELRYVPYNSQLMWSEQNFLVVFGISSVDIGERRRQRDLQRSTCWQFPGVATRANNFHGAMLVLYVLARHPSHHYEYSAALQEEAAQWNDIVTLLINEGRVTTNKKIAGRGSWGIEAEIGMSRKTYLWFEFALRAFPNVPYIAKGDDDIFLRAHQYIADLRTLPRQGLYWGYVFDNYVKMGGPRGRSIRYASGACYTVARDVAEQVVSYEPLKRLVHLPYNRHRLADFLYLNMDHEDLMVGYVLYERYKARMSNVRLLYAYEKFCSFHDLRNGPRVEPIRNSSIMVHHLWEKEYKELMTLFGNNTVASVRRWSYVKSDEILFSCLGKK